MTVGERLLRYPKEVGISQEELAQRMHVSRQTVSLWETRGFEFLVSMFF